MWIWNGGRVDVDMDVDMRSKVERYEARREWGKTDWRKEGNKRQASSVERPASTHFGIPVCIPSVQASQYPVVGVVIVVVAVVG